MKLQNPKLENWAVVGYHLGPYQAPEQGILALTGKVYNHPNPKNFDGKEVITSELKAISGARKVARTANTMYELGEPHPEFKRYLDSIGKTVEDYETIGISGAV